MSRTTVLELRQYALHPGQRDVLVDLFDREFVESQEALGMRILGQFRDLEDPDRFVWLRGFADLDSRPTALAAFYGGPHWAAHQDAANATMIAFDDVLLLRPTRLDPAVPANDGPRPPVGRTDPHRSLVTVTVHALTRPVTPELLDLVAGRAEPLLTGAGSPRLALLETEPARNAYPALPVREGEHVLVRLARFAGPDAHAEHLVRLRRSPRWGEVERELAGHLAGPVRELRLQPTARSLLH